MNKKNALGAVFLLLVLVCAGFAFAELTFSDAPTSGTSTSFYAGGAPQCVVDGDTANWEIYFEENKVDEINALKDCYRENGISGDAGVRHPSCCPSGYVCKENADTPGKSVCVPDNAEPPVSSCGDYETEADCRGHNIEDVEDFFYETILSNIPGTNPENLAGVCTGKNKFQTTDSKTGKCVWLVGCNCEWNGSDCNMNLNYLDCEETVPDEPSTYECSVVSMSDLLNLCSTEGVLKIDWTVKLTEIKPDGTLTDITNTPQTWCKSSSKTFDCPETEAGLPFFNLINLIVTCLAIALVYFVWKRK